MMEKIEIDIDKQLQPGDIVEMHFKTTGMTWLTAAHIAMIEWQIEKRKDFRIRSWTLPANNKVVFAIETLKTNPVIVTAAVIAAAIIGVGVVAWLTLDKVYQIVESPAGKVAAVGMGSLGIAAAIVIVLALFSKGK